MRYAPESLVRVRRHLVVAPTLVLILALASCSSNVGSSLNAPEGLRVVERDGAVDLAWLPVDAREVLGYRVFVAPADPPSASFELAAEVGAATTAASIDGLTNFTPYRFVVRTVGATAVSDPSEAVLGAPFSVASVPIDGFESDEEGEVVVLADGSRFRLLAAEELTESDGPEPPDFDLAALGPASRRLGGDSLGRSTSHLPDQFTLAAFQTAIRNQGGRGTCQTFAAVAAMEAEYRHLGFGSRDLSEQFASHIYRMTRLRPPAPDAADVRENTLGTGGGGSVEGVFGRLLRYRIPVEAEAPYVGSASYGNPNQDGDVPRIDPSDDSVLQSVYDDWNLQDEPTAYQIPSPLTHTPFPRDALTHGAYGITGFSKVPATSRHDPSWYEQVLFSGQEIALGFCFRDGITDDDGVWRTGAADEGCRGHAVLLIGYDRSDPDDPVFIAKNSWGGSAYQRLEYAFVTDPGSFLSADVLGGVTDPGRGNVHPQITLGRWDLVYDGGLATLDINRMSGMFEPSSLDGQQDRRLGVLLGASGDTYRVNGAATVGASSTSIDLDFHVDFADPALDYETLSGTHFTGYVPAAEPVFMAGTFSPPGSASTFGFYAHKDGPLPSVFAGAAGDPYAYLGTWRLLGLGDEDHLVITQMLPTGVFSGVTTHDAATVTGTVDVVSETVSFAMDDRAGIAGSVFAYLHNGDPGTASGTFTRGTNPAGVALVRVGDVPSVEIDPLGTLRSDGEVSLGATALGFADPSAVSIEWSYQIGAGSPSVAFATSASGEVFTATVPCDDLILTARAVDADRGLEAKDVAALSCVPASDTRLFHADRTLSGWVNDNGKLGTAVSGDVLLVGDDGFDHGYRSFLTFDWNLPEDLVAIDTAEVTIFLNEVQGTPYSTLNDLRAFHADYGDTLDIGDFTGASYLPGAATLPFDGTSSFGSMTFDVTMAVQDAWANRAVRGDRLQLVLQFSVASDGDGQADLATFLAEDEPGTSRLPYVEITYDNE